MKKKITLLLSLFIIIYLLSLSLLNFIINLIHLLYKGYVVDGTLLKPKLEPITLSLVTDFEFALAYSIVFVFIGVFSLLISSFILYKVKSNFGKLSNKQKGSSRFTTIKELQQQYKAVPEIEQEYKGGGGVPVSRYKDKVFIDDSAVNNLIVGTTRSGKGEMFIFPTIDIYSRAEKKPSLILNDPKGELYAASKETLEQRGYHVEVLNLMNPLQSMSNNLLQIVKEEYFAGNYSLAQQFARSIAFMLYDDPRASDPIWSQSSTNLCTALILALCEHCKNEPEKISMYNIALMLSDLSSRTVENENGEEESALIEFFKQFPANHPAKLQFASYEGAAGATRASILMNTSTQLGIFTLDGIAKLTSANTLDMTKVGFNHWIKGKTKPLTRIYITFPNGKKESIKTDANGIFNFYHNTHLEIGEKISIRVENQTTEFTVINWNEDSGDMVLEGDNELIKLNSVMQFEKPVAIFMIVPDYDASFNVIASIFVKQLYTTLARTASNVRSGKCFRETIFLLDEFGNMPPIDGMDNILTVCLGRNIRFNLIIQAYAQLEKLYGDTWKTIDGNTNNTFYILTDDYSTAEMISNKLGPKEIISKSRSGSTFSLDKSKTESVETRQLLSPDELMRLSEGEMVVIRTIKRQDKERKRIKQYPIFNTGKTLMKYRWEYLSDYFDTDKSINDIDIPCEHAGLDLDNIKVSFTDSDLNGVNSEIIEEDTEQEIIFINDEHNPNARKIPKAERLKQATDNKHQELMMMEQVATSIEEEIEVTAEVIDKKFFIQSFKDTDKFNSIFGEAYETMNIKYFRDLVIAYKDEFDEKAYLVLLQQIDYAMEQGGILSEK